MSQILLEIGVLAMAIFGPNKRDHFTNCLLREENANLSGFVFAISTKAGKKIKKSLRIQKYIYI